MSSIVPNDADTGTSKVDVIADINRAETTADDDAPVTYHDPLPVAQSATPARAEKKKAGVTPPSHLPAKGIFSSLSTSKILQQSPALPTGQPEIQPGTWSDAVPDDFYATPSVAKKLPMDSDVSPAPRPPQQKRSPPEQAGDLHQDSAQLHVDFGTAPTATETVSQGLSVTAGLTATNGYAQPVNGESDHATIPGATPAARIQGSPLREVQPARMQKSASRSPPKRTDPSQPANADTAAAGPAAVAIDSLTEPREPAKPESPPPPKTKSPSRESPHSKKATTSTPAHPSVLQPHGPARVKETPDTDVALAAPAEEEGIPSPLRSTDASRRRSLSAQRELAQLEAQRRSSSPKMSFTRPGDLFGDPPEETLHLRLRRSLSNGDDEDDGDDKRPRGFDKFEEEGRRKREALEAREAEDARRASQVLTFKPTISAVAKRRKTAETFDDFLAEQAQKQQETEQRSRRLAQAALEKEEEIRQSRFVNEHSQRLLEKRARRHAAEARDTTTDEAAGDKTKDASRRTRSGARLSIVDRLDEVVAMQRENRERLRRESQPTFQPQLATRGSRSSSAKNKAADSAAAGVPRLTDGNDSGAADSAASGSATGSPDAGARKKDKYAYFVSLYERTVAQKEATRAKLDQIKEQEADGASPKSQRHLTTSEAGDLVAAIERREAERKQRWENKLKKAAEQEEAELHKPKLSAKTEKLAQRAKSRWAVAEQRRKAELEEARRKEAERPLYVKTADSRSPAFTQHQTESIDRRTRRLEQLRQQKLEAELRECTFRPRLSPETERIAEHFSVEPTILELDPREPAEPDIVDDGVGRGDTEMGLGRVVRSTSSRRQSPMKEDPRLSSHDGISPLFDPNRRRLLNEIHPGGGDVNVSAMQSPAPRAPYTASSSLPRPAAAMAAAAANSSSYPQPRAAFSMDSDASLQSHIQSLEEVLQEWQSLERELSSTPPPRSAATTVSP